MPVSPGRRREPQREDHRPGRKGRVLPGAHHAALLLAGRLFEAVSPAAHGGPCDHRPSRPAESCAMTCCR